MSKALYLAMDKVASNLLKKFGVEVTFTQQTETGFNAGTGTPTFTTVVFTANAIRSFYDKREIDGTNIIAGDIKLTINNPATIPKVGDKCAINGSAVQRVMEVTPISPAEENIIFTIQLRI
jgi:hypothetical protein